jgi:deoxyadenosine/deoxycytidine kinase
MGKLISIVGNLGAGKTTLTKLLCENGPFIPYWERPEERPFQAEFTRDGRKWALANQMDFFLFRCTQESSIRQSNEIAVMDGGFDQDFHVFTCHIFNKGYISKEEFSICERFYRFTRSMLPPPDLMIRINIDSATLLRRRFLRGRKIADQDFSDQELSDIRHCWKPG